MLCEVVGCDEGQYVGVETFNIGKWKTLVLLCHAGKSGITAKGLEELDADLQQAVPDVVKKQLRAVAPLHKLTRHC